MAEPKDTSSGRPESLEDMLIPERDILPEFPAVQVTEEIAAQIVNGKRINLPEFSKAKLIRVFCKGRLIAICSRIAGTLFQPRTVLGKRW